MKKLFLTNHARERLAQRGIEIRDIEHALNNPGIEFPSKDDKKVKIKICNIEGKGTLQVFHKEHKNKHEIISAMWKGDR